MFKLLIDRVYKILGIVLLQELLLIMTLNVLACSVVTIFLNID